MMKMNREILLIVLGSVLMTTSLQADPSTPPMFIGVAQNFAPSRSGGMELNDIREVKPPLPYPDVWTGMLTGALIGIAVGLLFRYMRPFLDRARSNVRPVSSAVDEAFAQLKELEGRGLIARGQLKEYFTELSDIIRRYIEKRFSIHAPEMTTEEFLQSLKTSDSLNASHKDILKEFFNVCDMVKFAKHTPTVEEIQKSFQSARRFVEETKMGP